MTEIISRQHQKPKRSPQRPNPRTTTSRPPMKLLDPQDTALALGQKPVQRPNPQRPNPQVTMAQPLAKQLTIDTIIDYELSQGQETPDDCDQNILSEYIKSKTAEIRHIMREIIRNSDSNEKTLWAKSLYAAIDSDTALRNLHKTTEALDQWIENQPDDKRAYLDQLRLRLYELSLAYRPDATKLLCLNKITTAINTPGSTADLSVLCLENPHKHGHIIVEIKIDAANNTSVVYAEFASMQTGNNLRLLSKLPDCPYTHTPLLQAQNWHEKAQVIKFLDEIMTQSKAAYQPFKFNCSQYMQQAMRTAGLISDINHDDCASLKTLFQKIRIQIPPSMIAIAMMLWPDDFSDDPGRQLECVPTVLDVSWESRHAVPVKAQQFILNQARYDSVDARNRVRIAVLQALKDADSAREVDTIEQIIGQCLSGNVLGLITLLRLDKVDPKACEIITTALQDEVNQQDRWEFLETIQSWGKWVWSLLCGQENTDKYGEIKR